jgi:hypothetical protein
MRQSGSSFPSELVMESIFQVYSQYFILQLSDLLLNVNSLLRNPLHPIQQIELAETFIVCFTHLHKPFATKYRILGLSP